MLISYADDLMISSDMISFKLLFIFGCSGSSLPLSGFSLVVESGGASLLGCRGFSLQGLLWLQGTGSGGAGSGSCSLPAQLLQCMGLGALRHAGSSRIRDGNYVSWAGRRILPHSTTREVLDRLCLFKSYACFWAGLSFSYQFRGILWCFLGMSHVLDSGIAHTFYFCSFPFFTPLMVSDEKKFSTITMQIYLFLHGLCSFGKFLGKFSCSWVMIRYSLLFSSWSRSFIGLSSHCFQISTQQA